MLPLLCLLPTVLRRLIRLRRTAATCLLPTIYCLLLFLAATHGEGYNDQASSIQQTRDVGHIIVAGGTALQTPNDPDFLVFELRPDVGVDWQKVRSYIDRRGNIQQTSDGGYIVHGAPRSFGTGKEDLWVLKLKADGTIEWQKTYGGNCDDRGNILLQTIDGGYIVAGETCSFGAGEYDVWVLKLRPDGTVEWQKTYGGGKTEDAQSIQQTRDGGYIVAGDTYSFGAGKCDAWVLKLRPDGTIEWQKTYGGNSLDGGSFIRQTIDGGYIVVGQKWSFGAGGEDFWVLKLRADGAIEWQKTYGGDFFDWGSSIRQTRDGGYIVSGLTESFGAGKGDLWVLKLKADGAIEWQKTYGGNHDDGGRILQQTNDGGYVVVGYTESFGAGKKYDFWFLKLRADGTIEWQKTYGGNHDDRGSISLQTVDGGYIMSGWTESAGAGKKDLWVLRLRPDGSFYYAQDKSIDPACESVKETNLSVKDSNATVKDTTVSPVDSNANPQASSAIVQDTNIPVDLFCLPPTVRP